MRGFFLGICFLIVFSPIANASWDIWSGAAVQLTALALFTGWLIKSLLEEDIPGPKLNRNSAFLALFLFVCVCLSCFFFSVNKFNTRSEIFNLLGYAVVFLISSKLFSAGSGGRFHGAFYAAVTFIGLFVSVAGIIQLLNGQLPAGTMLNPNILAGYLVMIIPGSFIAAVENRHDKNPRNVYAFSFCVMLACLLFTKSLAGLAGLSVSLFIAVYVFYKDEVYKPYRLYFIIIFLAVYALLLFKLADTEVINRVFWWKAAAGMMADKPLFGVGPGNFGQALANYKAGTLNSLYAHNLFLQLGAESGIMALVLFLWFLSRVILRKANLNKPVFYGITAVLVQNMADYNLCIPANSILFWAMLGILCGENPGGVFAGIRLNREKRRIIIPVLVFVAIVCAAYAVKPFLASRCWVYGNELAGKVNRAGEALQGETFEKNIQLLEKAEKYLRRSIELDPLNFQYYRKLAAVYVKYYLTYKEKSWLDEALIEIEAARNYCRDVAVIYSDTAVIYGLKGEYSGAVEQLKAAIKLDANNPEYRRMLEKLVKSELYPSP